MPDEAIAWTQEQIEEAWLENDLYPFHPLFIELMLQLEIKYPNGYKDLTHDSV
jgi:hypothetical protein